MTDHTDVPPVNALAIIREQELDYRMKDNKCIVHGCSNHADQGRFVGEMCSPCHTMITTGKVMPTDSFLNQITSLEAEITRLTSERDELRELLAGTYAYDAASAAYSAAYDAAYAAAYDAAYEAAYDAYENGEDR